MQKGQESDEDDFDLGFGSNKKSKEAKEKMEIEAELAAMGSDEGESMTEEEQKKAIEGTKNPLGNTIKKNINRKSLVGERKIPLEIRLKK